MVEPYHIYPNNVQITLRFTAVGFKLINVGIVTRK